MAVERRDCVGWQGVLLDETLTLRVQMPFVKKQKTGAYFSRFQVKYRRRREGKTDCECYILFNAIKILNGR